MDLTLVIHRPDGTTETVPVLCRVDTLDEVAYYRHGGILHYVLRGMAKARSAMGGKTLPPSICFAVGPASGRGRRVTGINAPSPACGRLGRGDPDAGGIPHGLLGLVSFDLRRVSIAEGVRAALASAAIVALDEWLHWPPMMQAALAALLTCLADPGGPIRRRLPAILSFGVLGALVTVGYGLLRNLPLPVVVPVACAGIFCALYVRVLGQAAQQVGNLLTVVQVLALTRVIADARTALELGGAFWAGSLWAALLTLVIWRVHPFLPARRAVAQVYRTLASQTADLRAVLLLRNRRGGDVGRARPQPPPRGARGDRAGARGGDGDPAHPRPGQRARRPDHDPPGSGRADLRRAHRPVGPAGGAPRRRGRCGGGSGCCGCCGRCCCWSRTASRPTRSPACRAWNAPPSAIAATASDRAGAAGAPPRRWPSACASPPTSRRRRGRFRAPRPASRCAWRCGGAAARLRANLDWRSDTLRHALRGAVAAAPALALTLHWQTSYGHWLTIMLVLTMQPQVAITFARALERVAGTVAGGLRGGGAGHRLHHAARHRGGAVPARRAGARGAAGQFRAVHGVHHAADRAAVGTRPARRQRTGDRGDARAVCR